MSVIRVFVSFKTDNPGARPNNYSYKTEKFQV